MKIHNNIHEYTSINPKKYSLLKEIKFHRSEEGNYDAEIVMCSNLDWNKRIIFYFINTSNININNIEGFRSLLIDIVDVSDMQLESAKFKVSELEEDAFSFFCDEFLIFSDPSIQGIKN